MKQETFGAMGGAVENDDDADAFATFSDGTRICYRMSGPDDGVPLLLLAGLSLQLTAWPETFVQGFVDAGYRVIAPDNRDAGLSTRFRTRPPGKLRQLLAWPPADNYSLGDMADDMARLLRHLDVGPAHLLGMSMGGMIAQSIAARYPELTRSLTSIFSTSGSPRVGQPARSTILRMAHGAPRTVDEAIRQHVAMMRHIGDPDVPGIEAQWTDYARRAWVRNGNRANAGGVGRQIGAIHKSGDRSGQLARIVAPALVLHGDIDRMVDPSGGRATASAIPGARFVTVKGMRHQIDTMRVPALLAQIVPHLREADTHAATNAAAGVSARTTAARQIG